MAFIDTIISEVSLILSYLSEIVGLTPIGLISALALLVLLFILGIFIIIEFIRIRQILMDVNRRIVVMGQKAVQHSPESKLKKIFDDKRMLDQKQNNIYESTHQLDDAEQSMRTFSVPDELQIHGRDGLSGKLKGKTIGNTSEINIEDSSDPLTSNQELKIAVLKLLNASDMPLSLKYLAENLSDQYFDGNYNPILSELGQLEKEGQIEGTSKGGKVYFRKK